MWLEGLLTRNLWLTLLVWTALYALDYVQTLRGARLYHTLGKRYVSIEGSYELTPFFQDDIDSFKKVSFRFLIILGFALGGLMLIYWLANEISIPEGFSFAAGGLILRSVVVHMQHVQNISLYRYLERHPEQASGSITYSRPLVYSRRAVEFSLFGALFLTLFAVTGSWFLAGGALGCFAIGLRMLVWRRRKSPATGVRGSAIVSDQAKDAAPSD